MWIQNWEWFSKAAKEMSRIQLAEATGRTHPIHQIHPIRARGPCWKHRSCIQLPAPRWCHTGTRMELTRTWRLKLKTPMWCLKTATSQKKNMMICTSWAPSEVLDIYYISKNLEFPVIQFHSEGMTGLLPTWERAAKAKFFRKKTPSYHSDLHQYSQHGVKKLLPIFSDQDNKRVLTVRGLNLSQKVAGFWCSSSALGRNRQERFPWNVSLNLGYSTDQHQLPCNRIYCTTKPTLLESPFL